MEVMRAMRKQTTLARPCSISGRGYWSGEPNQLTLVPAAADTGIRFVRSDLVSDPVIEAVAENRISMPLRTRLSNGRAEVDMVEHVLAALFGLQIDNVEVYCTAREMPGMDGSCLALAIALQKAGSVELAAARRQIRILEPIQVGQENEFVRIEPHPLLDKDQAETGGDSRVAPQAGKTAASVLEVEYTLDYGSDSPIEQATYRAAVNPLRFAEEIAPARTFVRREDAAALQRQGLALHVTERDLLVFDQSGPMNNSLRFRDECARHKVLDLIGDLALTGVDLVGRVIARRSGHQLNGALAERIREIHGVHQSLQVETAVHSDAA